MCHLITHVQCTTLTLIYLWWNVLEIVRQNGPWSVLGIVPEKDLGINLGLDLGIDLGIDLWINLKNTF